jgi:hypothetical protein
MSKTVLQVYLEQAKAKGYIIESHEHPIALADRGNFIHLVCSDGDNECWFVGRWYKSTLVSSGDYNGHPEFEDQSLEKCLEYIRDWVAATN